MSTLYLSWVVITLSGTCPGAVRVVLQVVVFLGGRPNTCPGAVFGLVVVRVVVVLGGSFEGDDCPGGSCLG